MMIVKPFVVLAARCMGPGRLRLEMVKLAHDLGGVHLGAGSLYGRQLEPRPALEAALPRNSRRAA